MELIINFNPLTIIYIIVFLYFLLRFIVMILCLSKKKSKYILFSSVLIGSIFVALFLIPIHIDHSFALITDYCYCVELDQEEFLKLKKMHLWKHLSSDEKYFLKERQRDLIRYPYLDIYNEYNNIYRNFPAYESPEYMLISQDNHLKHLESKFRVPISRNRKWDCFVSYAFLRTYAFEEVVEISQFRVSYKLIAVKAKLKMYAYLVNELDLFDPIRWWILSTKLKEYENEFQSLVNDLNIETNNRFKNNRLETDNLIRILSKIDDFDNKMVDLILEQEHKIDFHSPHYPYYTYYNYTLFKFYCRNIYRYDDFPKAFVYRFIIVPEKYLDQLRVPLSKICPPLPRKPWWVRLFN